MPEVPKKGVEYPLGSGCSPHLAERTAHDDSVGNIAHADRSLYTPLGRNDLGKYRIEQND